MADSFFGFDTSLSNLNDDEGGGGPSEDEYDALNDETFGQDSEEFDWEVEHETLAQQLESNRRNNSGIDETANTQLEASLSQLVLDETDSPHSRAFGSSVWRHDLSTTFTAPRTPVPTLKNVCTVEELERQLRQKQMSQPTPMSQQQMSFTNQNYFQPRFPPVILQRPPGLQAPVPLPFAPQQTMTHNINPLNQPLNKIIGQNTQINQMSQTNLMQNHLSSNVNQLSQNINQLNPSHLGQNMNQLNSSQLGQNVNQLNQNANQLSQNQNVNQLSQSQLTQNVNQMNQNQLGQNVNQFMQNANQMVGQYQNNPIGSSNLMNQLSQNMQNVHQMNQSNQLLHNQNQLLQNSSNQLLQNQSNQLLQNQPNQIMQGQSNQLMQGQPNQLMQNQLNQSQMGQNVSQLTQNQLQNVNLTQNMNHLSQNVSQMGQNMGQMGQNVSQMSQNVNQMMPNGNQFGMNQYPRMMGQPRMMAPPPGMNMPRQNFSSNMGQFNHTFRGPTIQSKPTEQPPMSQNMPINQQYQQLKPLNQTSQITKQSPNQQLSTQKTNQIQQTNQNQQKIQKTDPKVQKSRIYNNSKSQPQSLTSENLVQMIQNTHPMLQYNNSYHNASHHPMLNRNLFSNNPMLNNHLLYNQRHNGTYNNNRHMNGDDASANSDDEYAGLMTQREKQWLINIQMLQLNTGTPYIHDFYYTVFLERQASKEKEGVKEAHKANQQNHPFYSGAVKQESHTHTRERHNSMRHNSTSEDGAGPRTYVPTQFENSLGKLQCGSVTAPRKIIDVEVVGGESTPRTGRNSRAPSRASTANPAEVPRELKRTKQLLLDIEALYIILLRLEELNDPLAISNALILKEREEKQKLIEAAQKEALENEQEEDSNLFLRNIESVQRRPKQDSPKSESIDKRQVVNLAVNQKPAPVKNLLDEDKDELINKMFSGLLHSDRLSQMLTVRKGRSLVARFLPLAGASRGQLRAVWSRVLRALPAAARRDPASLAALAPHYHRYIQNTTGWSAILESCSLLSEAFDPARTPYALTTAFTLSCVCALLDKASALVNTPEATANERQWSKFLKTLARALKNTNLTVAKPIQPLTETKLIHHMRQLDSRSTIEILQRGRTAAEFADLSKADVTEQLIKHLC